MKPENISETYVFIKCIAIQLYAIKHFSDSFFSCDKKNLVK